MLSIGIGEGGSGGALAMAVADEVWIDVYKRQVKERMSCKELITKLVKETDALIKGAGFYE